MNLRNSIAALAVASAFAATPAQAVTIGFDDVADGTDIASTYAGLGVTFNNPIGDGIFARSSTVNASPSNVVSVFDSGVPAFDARWGAVEAVFSSLQRFVSIDAAILRLPEGLGTPQNAPKLEVYDNANNLIGVVNWNFSQIAQPGAGGITGFQTLDFSAGSDVIAKVRFLSGQPGGSPSNFGIFDNLVFTGGNTVPEPGTLGLLSAALLAGITLRRRQQQQ